MSLICSNRECSPLQPLTGQRLVRKYYEDPNFGKCPQCKSVYDIEVMTDGKYTLLDREILCTKCNVKLKPGKRWHYQCPKCGRNS